MCSKLKIRLLRMLTFMLVVLAVACGKKTNSPTPINPFLVKHFSYQPGTYWVYRDSIRGTIDSFYVSSNYSSVENDNNGSYQFISIMVTCATNDTMGGKITLYKNYGIWDIGLPTQNDGIDYSNGLGIEYPFPSNWVFYLFYTVQSIQYNNVEQSGYYRSGLPSFNETYFLSTDVGLIRIRIDDTSQRGPQKYTLELLRYAIVN